MPGTNGGRGTTWSPAKNGGANTWKRRRERCGRAQRNGKNMPAVSIIIPNYNHGRYLRLRIGSVLRQTYNDFEVIVLDDGSTDNSREIIESYARDEKVRIDYNSQNSGNVFKQWNKGVQKARGRYVWIAESDDYADTAFLSRMVPLLERNPEVAFAHCRSWRVDENGNRQGFADAELERLDAKHWT